MNTDIVTNERGDFMTKKQITDLIILALSAALMIAEKIINMESLPEVDVSDKD